MRKLFLTSIFFILQLSSVSAELFISEVFPNTIDDKNLEYIELINTWETEIDISGYAFADKSEKRYIFPEELFIDSWERLRFERIETRLILNNSNEEIYLYDTDENQIDFFSYESSTKSEPIEIEVEISTEEIEEKSKIEQEIPEIWEDDPWWFLSWLIGYDIPEESETQYTDGPKIQWIFQQPSYIKNKDQLLYWYACERQDCKINLDLRDSFAWEIKESNYRCEIDFGFETWEEHKCNPNTIFFWTWSFDVKMQIFEKETERLVAHSKFFIENIPESILPPVIDENVTERQSSLLADAVNQDLEQNDDIETEGEDMFTLVKGDVTKWQGELSWELDTSQEYMVPEIIPSLQQPSYAVEENGFYMCDTSREECKINFDFRESFSDELPEKDYICITDFGFETEQENKCNPSTVVFPVWTHEITIRITHEDDQTVFSERSLLVQNDWYIPEVSSSENSDLSSEAFVSQIYITKPDIQVQSWLEEINGKYFCKKSLCKVNLIYEPRWNHEICDWNFSQALSYTPGTEKKCNPWYIEYGYGSFEIGLRVSQKDYEKNRKYQYLSFENKEIIEELSEEEIEEVEEEKEDQIDLDNSEIQIILQWKVGKWKTLRWNILECEWVYSCYANFIANGSFKEDQYIWDFGNGETYTWKNPKWIWFEIWEHTVTLRTWNEISEFFIYVYEEVWILKQEEDNLFTSESISLVSVDELNFDSYNYRDLSIGRILANPKANDIKEWLEIINTWWEKINLKWCKIDDITDGWSRAYQIKEDFFIWGWEIYRFYKLFTGLNLNNAGDEVSITCHDELIDSFAWDFKLDDNLSLSHAYPYGKYIYITHDFSQFSSEQYDLFINKTFTQNERLLKSWFKISWETLPNAKVRIILWNGMQDIYLVSDIDGLYEVLLTSGLKAWVFSPQTEITDATWKIFLFQSDKKLEITAAYIQSLIKIKKTKTASKAKIPKPKSYFISVANASDDLYTKKETPFEVLLIFLVMILWFLTLFLVVKRRAMLD